MAEYNDYMNAVQKPKLEERVTQLDHFVSKYPHSDLLSFIYQVYYSAYNDMKLYDKAIEYADKYLLTAQAENPVARLGALAVRTKAFELSYNESNPNAHRELEQARDAAVQAIGILDKIPKPANVSTDQFAAQKRDTRAFYEYAAGYASLGLKDYAAAVTHLEFAASVNERDPFIVLQLGLAKLKLDPPATLDGYWALARFIALSTADETKPRLYLRDLIQRYQQASCTNLVDDELKNLIEQAGANAKRPASYVLPSADDLQKVRETAGPILDDLRAGDERAKLVWLSVCGLEFPEVGVRVLSATNTDGAVILDAFRAPTEKEMEAGTEANMKITVAGA